MADVVWKIDHRTRVEKTNYFKSSYISNTQLWMLQLKSSSGILFVYIFLLLAFLYLIFTEVGDVKLMFSVPFLYVWLVIYFIWLFFFIKGKTTLRGVKRIYEIIWDFYVIMKDNYWNQYNKKNKICVNELKEVRITI